VEATLVEVFGEQAAVSRTTVSRICQRLLPEFDAWCRRDLSGTRVDYLYLGRFVLQDAPQGSGRAGAGGPGHRHRHQALLPGVAPGAAESTDAWRALLADLTDRLHTLLVVSDGGKGLCAAIERCFPASLHQRCLRPKPFTPSTKERLTCEAWF
jgi:putative transposase